MTAIDNPPDYDAIIADVLRLFPGLRPQEVVEMSPAAIIALTRNPDTRNRKHAAGSYLRSRIRTLENLRCRKQ